MILFANDFLCEVMQKCVQSQHKNELSEQACKNRKNHTFSGTATILVDGNGNRNKPPSLDDTFVKIGRVFAAITGKVFTEVDVP